MKSIDCLVDIAAHMSAVDKDGIIKVFGEGDNTFAVIANGKFDQAARVEAQLNGNAGIGLASMFGYFKSYAAIPELKNRSIGLGRMKVLTGFAKVHAAGDCEFIYEDGQPIEIHFDSGDGYEARYRLTSSAMINELVKVPKFIGGKCDVTFVPDAKAINLFKKNAIAAKDNDKLDFWPMMNSRGYMYFSFDRDAPTNRTDRFEMARGLAHVDLPPHCYEASQLKRVLALASNAKSLSIGVSKLGYLRIDIATEFGEYIFILLGSDYNIWAWDWATKWPKVWGVETKMYEDQCMHVDWEPPL